MNLIKKQTILNHFTIQYSSYYQEASNDHEQWYKPKFKIICEFHDKVLDWINNASPALALKTPERHAKVTKAGSVKSLDNVSVGMISRKNVEATASTSALKQVEAERALQARAAAQKKMHEFELEEAKLEAKKKRTS